MSGDYLVWDHMASQLNSTLNVMQGFIDIWKAHPAMVGLARRIVAIPGAKSPLQEAEAVRQWIHDQIQYRRDPEGVEYVQDPTVTLTERTGDCDDLATLAGVLLAAIGHQMRAVAVAWEGRNAPSHAVVRDNTARAIVDPVAAVPVSSWPPVPYRVGAFVEASR